MTEPSVLFHYTSADGLLGMLGTPHKSPTVWLSHIQYMNDKDEYWHAYELIIEKLRALQNHYEPLVAQWAKGEYESRGRGQFLRDYFSQCFVMSLSQAPDLLSQWRGYARDGGYSVGFKQSDLVALAAKHGLALTPCIYTEQDKQRLIDYTINQLHAEAVQRVVDPAIAGDPRIPDSDKPMASWRYKFERFSREFASCFKQQSFSEEREMRLVGTVPPLVAGEPNPLLKWRTRGNLILPYCELDIGRTGGTPMPVHEIIVGPGVQFAHAKATIDALTTERRMANNPINVRASVSTLRW